MDAPRIVTEHPQGYNPFETVEPDPVFGELEELARFYRNHNPFVIVTNEMDIPLLIDRGANQGIYNPINPASIRNARFNPPDNEDSDDEDYEDMPNLQEDGGEESHVD